MAGKATSGMVTAPPNSFGSVSVNGQLVGVQTSSAYYPKNFGGGISATPAGSPVTIPPAIGYGLGATPTPVPSGSNSRVGATASIPGGSTSSGTQNRGSYNGPFMGSPAMWAIGFMAFGILWLRFVHWRKPSAREE
jgi:hypothetical protein